MNKRHLPIQAGGITAKKIFCVYVLVTGLCFSAGAFSNGPATGITSYIEHLLNDGPPSDAFRFGVAADTHLNFGGPDRWRDKELLAIFNSWAKAKAKFGIIVGDVGTDETKCLYLGKPTRQPEKLLELIRAVSNCPPILFTMGNHELDGEGKKAWLDALFPGATTCVQTNGNDRYVYWSFNCGQCHFICLDANRMEGNKIIYSHMPDEEYDWLQRDLEQHKYALTFVFLHEPLEDYQTKGLPRRPFHIFSERGRLIGLLQKYSNVKWVFSGHVHSHTHLQAWNMNVCKTGINRAGIIEVKGTNAVLFDVDAAGRLTPAIFTDYCEMENAELIRRENEYTYCIAETELMNVAVSSKNNLSPFISFVGPENGVVPTKGPTMMKIEKTMPGRGEKSFTPLYCYMADNLIEIKKGTKFIYDVFFDKKSVYDNFALELEINTLGSGDISSMADQSAISMNNIGFHDKYGFSNKTYYSPSMQGLASGVWYHREFDLSPLAGGYIVMLRLYATRPDRAPYSAGILRFYLDNIKLTWRCEKMSDDN